MNDYNRGVLPDPCLRLPYGFGDDWKSVELGDGTGYVRLADYEKVEVENAKLRDAMFSNAKKHALHHMDEDELRIWATQQEEYIEELKELVLKNWYIALSEREALRANDIDPDGGTYMAALDDEIATAKDRMRDLGIEADDE